MGNNDRTTVKCILIGVLTVAAYLALFGPVSWLSERMDDGKVFSFAYRPVLRWMLRMPGGGSIRDRRFCPDQPAPLKTLIFDYMLFGIRQNTVPEISTRDWSIRWTSRPIFFTGPGWSDQPPPVNRFFVRPSPPSGGGFGGSMGK